MISQIEDAIIKRISDVNGTGDSKLGYTLKKIATYGGEFTEGLRSVIRDFPAVWLLYFGQTLLKSTNNKQTFKVTFNIMVAATNLRNEAAARKGADGKVGSYQLVEDMIALVAGQTLGLDISAFQVTRVRPLLNDMADKDLASVYGIEVTTNYTTERMDDPGDIGDFRTFHTNYDIPEHGNVDKDIPSDDSADATDHVTLETE